MKIYVSEKDLSPIQINQIKEYGEAAHYFQEDIEGYVKIAVSSLEQHDKELRLQVYKEAYEQGKFDVKADLEYKINLEQHEQEIRKQERQKVIAELEEFENEQRLRVRKISKEYPTDNEEQKARLYALSSGRFDILENLKQKLNEMKGE